MIDIENGWYYLADLNPKRGTEPGKTRPVLVIQTNLLNEINHPSTIIVPITANVKDDAEPLRVRISKGRKGFKVDSDLMIDQVRAIDNRRFYKGSSKDLIKKIAPADLQTLQKVQECLKRVLEIT